MPRKKDQLKLNIPKLTNKEVLIAYASTLNEKQAKEAYQILLERFDIHRARVIKFNRNGVQDTNGKVRLTQNQYNKIISEKGELYFHSVVEILYDYIVYLEERSQSESTLRSRLREYNRISHYYKLTKGWVAERYQKEYGATHSNYNKTLSVWDINTLEEAQRYYNELPSELRINNPEIDYLVTKFPSLIL